MQEPCFGGERNGDDDEIDAVIAGELRELRDLADLVVRANRFRAALVVAVVEQADDFDNRQRSSVRAP